MNRRAAASLGLPSASFETPVRPRRPRASAARRGTCCGSPGWRSAYNPGSALVGARAEVDGGHPDGRRARRGGPGTRCWGAVWTGWPRGEERVHARCGEVPGGARGAGQAWRCWRCSSTPDGRWWAASALLEEALAEAEGGPSGGSARRGIVVGAVAAAHARLPPGAPSSSTTGAVIVDDPRVRSLGAWWGLAAGHPACSS